MIRVVASRLAQSLLVMLVMSFAIYGLIGLMPGDPIDIMISADPDLTAEDARRLKALYGLEQPIVARWWNWLAAAVAGDLGYSRLYAAPVAQILGPALGNTLWLLGLAFSLALLIAFPAGVFAATKPFGIRDRAIGLLSFTGISIPSFWFALLLIVLFAVVWEVLPASGTGVIGSEPRWQSWHYLVLPIATLTFASVGGHTRFVRGAMIEALSQDFIRTARAKGLSETRVIWGHGLPNALIPIVTILGLEFGTLFSGALITETVFAWPGMGKLIFDSIMGSDFNLALAALLLATAVTLAGNFAADLLYAWLDPRVAHR